MLTIPKRTALPSIPHSYHEKPKYECQFFQYNYSTHLYRLELALHDAALAEYDAEVYQTITGLVDANRPNMELYRQQPYLTFAIRLKLIDFLLKMSIRLKILPFVFYKAVKIFDRYCSKRIVLLDQSQLIITTCLWIASKVQGGNNHFVNLSNIDKLTSVKTINDLGYGSGGKYLGPTERFRLPKLHELVKLCGAKCKYDQGMFKQMELHVLSTLDWALNDPSIEEFIVSSDEFSIIPPPTTQPAYISPAEMFKIKEYLSYVSLYTHELIDVSPLDLAQVILDVINEIFALGPDDYNYQYVLSSMAEYNCGAPSNMAQYSLIKKSLIKSVLNSSDFIHKLFNSSGPQHLFRQVATRYGSASGPGAMPVTPTSDLACTPRKRYLATASSSPASNTSTCSTTPPTSLMLMMKKSAMTPPTATTPFPPAHFGPINTPLRLPAPHQVTGLSFSPPGPKPNIYKPVYVTSCHRNYKLPNVITSQQQHHQHHQQRNPFPSHQPPLIHQSNDSQASLNSSTSSRGDADLFEVDKNEVNTPVSANESPFYAKAAAAF